jgi:hypothetical protein
MQLVLSNCNMNGMYVVRQYSTVSIIYEYVMQTLLSIDVTIYQSPSYYPPISEKSRDDTYR